MAEHTPLPEKELRSLSATIRELLRTLAYREGRFKLASGKESTFYVDVRNVSLHPIGAKMIGDLACELTGLAKDASWGGVGGPTLGADPIATAVSLAALSRGRELPAFLIRKEPKPHGTSQWIEGRENLRPGARLLLLEDVVTTGGSSIKAIERLRSEGFVVDTLLAVLDREEGGAQALAAAGVNLVAMARIAEIRKSS